MEKPRNARPAGATPTVADIAAELARHADAQGMVEPGIAAQLVAEYHWTGRLVDVLALLTDDPDRMGYLAGGRRPDEVATWLDLWAQSPLSLDEIALIVASGGWDPEPFVVLARAGLLEPLLRMADGTPRRVRGELAGAWVSDELALASDADVLEAVSNLLQEEAGAGRTGAGQGWSAR